MNQFGNVASDTPTDLAARGLPPREYEALYESAGSTASGLTTGAGLK